MQLGGVVKFEVDYSLFNIEKGKVGFSFIPIYCNDVWLRPFVEVIHSPDWGKPMATVEELITLETSALYIMNSEPSIGVGYRLDENKAYFLWEITGTLGWFDIGIKTKVYPEFPRAKSIYDFNISNFEFSIEKVFQMPWKF